MQGILSCDTKSLCRLLTDVKQPTQLSLAWRLKVENLLLSNLLDLDITHMELSH